MTNCNERQKKLRERQVTIKILVKQSNDGQSVLMPTDSFFSMYSHKYFKHTYCLGCLVLSEVLTSQFNSTANHSFYLHKGRICCSVVALDCIVFSLLIQLGEQKNWQLGVTTSYQKLHELTSFLMRIGYTHPQEDSYSGYSTPPAAQPSQAPWRFL